MAIPKIKEQDAPTHRILVVDDDETVVQLVSKFLRKRGYEVETCFSGEDCILKIAEFQPELVLLDFNLPGIDGLETLKRIRLEKEASQVMVVLVTAQSDREIVESSLKLGIDDFIVKPFSLESMAERLERHLSDEGLDVSSVKEMLRNLPLIEERLIAALPLEEGLDRSQFVAYPVLRDDTPYAVMFSRELNAMEASKLPDAELRFRIRIFAKRTHWKQVWPKQQQNED